MKLPSFIGLVGGKPRFAYYFVGQLEKPAGLGSNFENDDDYVSASAKDSYAGAAAASDPDSNDSPSYNEADRLIFLDPHYVNSQVDFTKDVLS